MLGHLELLLRQGILPIEEVVAKRPATAGAVAHAPCLAKTDTADIEIAQVFPPAYLWAPKRVRKRRRRGRGGGRELSSFAMKIEGITCTGDTAQVVPVVAVAVLAAAAAVAVAVAVAVAELVPVMLGIRACRQDL